jgi:hypothetical protein
MLHIIRMSGPYSSDWGHVRRSVGLAYVGGGVCGWIYGVSRAMGATGALLAATQVGVFAGSFFVIREGEEKHKKKDGAEKQAKQRLSTSSSCEVLG